MRETLISSSRTPPAVGSRGWGRGWPPTQACVLTRNKTGNLPVLVLEMMSYPTEPHPPGPDLYFKCPDEMLATNSKLKIR